MNTCKSYLNGRLPVPTGCKLHDDCFTCKFKDCMAPTSDNVAVSSGRREMLQANKAAYKLACELHDQGLRNIDIARELGKGRSLISTWLRKYREDKENGAVRTV